MGAGLKRHIGGGAARQFAGFGQRLGLGMRAAADSGDACADDHRAGAVVAHDDGANGRVGRGAAGIAARQPDGRGHEAAIQGRLLGLAQVGSSHGQPASSSVFSSSPFSSPSNSWKSLASRKLR